MLFWSLSKSSHIFQRLVEVVLHNPGSVRVPFVFACGLESFPESARSKSCLFHVKVDENWGRSRPVARSSPVRAPPPRRATAGVEIVSTSYPCGIRPEKVSPESRFIPKSLSVVDMLKLGNQIKRTTSAIEIYNFDFQAMAC